MKIGDNVLFWQGIWAGSGFAFAKDAVVAVDAQSRRDQVDLMLEFLKLYGLDSKNVKYLVYTHNDIDHIGGNAEFLERIPRIKIVAGAEDVAKIEDPLKGVEQKGFMAERVIENLEPCKVDVRVDKDMSLEAGSLKLQIIRTPGHTPGSLCIYHADSETLFTGDTVLGYGRWAGPKGLPLVRADSLEPILDSLKKISGLKVKWLLPGHGKPVPDGNKRIQQVIADLKSLPKQVLGALGEAHSASEISDKLLVYPATVETAIQMLEREGKVKRAKGAAHAEAKWVATV